MKSMRIRRAVPVPRAATTSQIDEVVAQVRRMVASDLFDQSEPIEIHVVGTIANAERVRGAPIAAAPVTRRRRTPAADPDPAGSGAETQPSLNGAEPMR